MSSTEIAVRQPHDTDSWVQMLPAVGELADVVNRTEFVPGPLRGHAPAVAAAILAGREIGLPPMQSLQHVHIIDGRPTLSAQMQRSLALAAGYDIRIVETNTTRCIVEGRRSASDEWTRVTWTVDDAKKAGLLGRTNWQKHPRRMLQARATAELCQLIFSDAIAGMAATEEAEDDVEGPAPQLNGQTEPGPRTARRRTTPKDPGPAARDAAPPSANPAAGPGSSLPPLPGEDETSGPAPSGQPAGQEPATGPDPTTSGASSSARAPEHTSPTKNAGQSQSGSGSSANDEADYDSPGTVTPQQLTKIWATLTGAFDFKHDEKEQARIVCGQIIGADLGSSKELSRNQASTVLDTLANWQLVAESEETTPKDVLIAQMVASDAQADDD